MGLAYCALIKEPARKASAFSDRAQVSAPTLFSTSLVRISTFVSVNAFFKFFYSGNRRLAPFPPAGSYPRWLDS